MRLESIEALGASSLSTVDLYEGAYSHSAQQVYKDIRLETYGPDLGQTGWMNEAEFVSFFPLLGLTSTSNILEVGCGAGGCALYLARTGASITGIDVNESGIRNARKLAQGEDLAGRCRFEQVDGEGELPFPASSFDAIYSNDAMCHLLDRLAALRNWHKMLKSGGRLLFTDAMVITGPISNAEIASRSSIGRYLFVPPGENERLIAAAGLTLLSSRDLTASVVDISRAWREARERRREALTAIEGESNFAELQDFLACVHSLSQERRLSRYMYLAAAPEA